MSAMIPVENRGTWTYNADQLSLFVSSSCSSKKLQSHLSLLTLCHLTKLKSDRKYAKLSQVGKQPNHRLILMRFNSVFCGDLACEFKSPRGDLRK